MNRGRTVATAALIVVDAIAPVTLLNAAAELELEERLWRRRRRRSVELRG